uniref:Uncharacterized protein n=1 Tax=Chromera velia CCMP2878 TaxID=1169474 RepID=A0A0G4HTB0_9ALVE|eukprot:Cvel_8429.t1-p1 / transcript=Cvel_8429.t1 / gene=Cvel_8429 / organism=Chromera_velia_CCMP2878 / gene_product=hypothetical protein / transcript_product=hypothetical protein / location=Cvel_scaffold465:64030-65391(-) / protein_length=139 / sequence_SO=supercontig / SO=protein_coding / is_pseudo=false
MRSDVAQLHVNLGECTGAFFSGWFAWSTTQQKRRRVSIRRRISFFVGEVLIAFDSRGADRLKQRDEIGFVGIRLHCLVGYGLGQCLSPDVSLKKYAGGWVASISKRETAVAKFRLHGPCEGFYREEVEEGPRSFRIAGR